MARPPPTQNMQNARRALAAKIRDGMDRGLKFEGAAVRRVQPWTIPTLATALRASDSAVEKWTSKAAPVVPQLFIGPIADLFYGSDPEFKAERDALFLLYDRAMGRGGPPPEEPDGFRDFILAGGHAIDGLVGLSLSPEKANQRGPETWSIKTRFVINIRDGIERLVDNRRRCISIGLTEAELHLITESFEIDPGTMAGDQGRENKNLQALTKGIRIKGPKPRPCGRIDGFPLTDTHLVTLVRNNVPKPRLEVTVVANRRAFKVTVDDNQSTLPSAKKDMIANQMLADAGGEIRRRHGKRHVGA
jgi:hypothetical protein